MAVNVKMGVDIGSFKQGIREGQQILKSLDAEMKVTEAEFKATGNAEKQMADKTRILTSQMNVQKGVIDQMQKALKKMADAGIQPTDQAYQKLNAQMLNAQAAMYQTQAELNNLDGSQQKAAGSADKLTNSLSGIGKKLSLDQVISGVNAVTQAMESAGRKALQLGEELWDNILNSARWADDTATMAQMYGIDVETFQQMQKLVTNGLDTTVEAMLKAQSKLKKGIGSDSKDIQEALEAIGVTMTETIQGGKIPIEQARDSLEVFWEAGQKILRLGDENKQEDLAQKLFGRSWHELVPLFESYKTVEEYNAALENTQIVSAEMVENGATLNDKISELEGNFQTLKDSMLLSLAPALTEVSTALNGVLTSVLDYLKTDQGKEMLQEMGDAVTQLFSGIKDISAEDVVKGFKDVFDGLVDGLKWVVYNKDVVIGALGAIISGWGGLKLFGAAADMLKLINGLQSLLGIGGGAATGAGATGAAATGVATWASGLISGIGQGAFNMALYDSAGALALAPYMFMDKTAAGQALQHGEGIDGAIEAGRKEIELAATQTVQNWVDYGVQLKNATETIINSTLDFASSRTLTDTLNGGLVLHLDADELSKEWQGLFGGGNKENEPELPVKPELPADAQQQLQNAMDSWNPMKIYVTPVIQEPQGNLVQGHANGLPWVPYDGYLAMLHRGERVLTASENRSYTYNSNNYFGNVNLNNGQDIDALCDSIDRHNRRQRSGYGS